ncbi:MAG: EAL domain-containing protein [Patescibacteria group bacterium]
MSVAIEKQKLETIDSRKQVKSARVNKSEKFKFIIENMRSAVLTFNMEKELTFVNKSFKQLTGYSLSELDNDFIKCVSYQDQFRVGELWLSSFSGYDFTEEVSVITKSGDFITLSFFCHPMLDKYDNQIGVYLRIVDMVKYRKDKFVKQQAEAEIRKAIYSAPFPALITTQNGVTIEINKQWADLTGDTKQSLPNFKNWIDSLAGIPDSKPSLFDSLTDPQLSNSAAEIEIPILKHKRIWQIKSSRIGTTAEGIDLYLFMGVDLTERKAVETRLIDSERKLRLVTNNIQAAVIAYNNDKKLIYANAGFACIIGKNEPIDSLKLFLHYVHPQDLKGVSKIIRQAYKGKGFRDFQFRLLCYGDKQDLLKTKNSDSDFATERKVVKWVSSMWSPLVSEDGQKIGLQLKIIDITEKRKVEEALKLSESNIRAILNNTSQCFMLINKDYCIKTFNNMANSFTQRIYGIELVKNLSFKDIVSSEDSLDFKNCFEFALKGYPITIERNIKGKYRQDNWFEMSFVPVRESSSEINFVCLGILDISIRKRANKILEASENRFKSLVQNSSDFTSILDKKYKIKYFSPTAKNIFGYKPGILIHNSYLNYVHPHDQQIFVQAVKNVLGKDPIQIEYRFKNQSNEWIYLQSIITDLTHDSSVAGIVINSRDITQTTIAQQDLKDSKHFIQRIADSMPNILFLYELVDDSSLRLVYVNKSIKSTLSYEPLKMLTQQIMRYKDFIHPNDIKYRLNSLEKINNITEDEVVETELRVKDNKNRWRWMYVREVIFSRNEDGSIKQILGTAEDITRRKRAEDQLARGALYDTLTGLPNRRYFLDKLTAAIKKKSKDADYDFAVLFLDLDRFKIINDSLGHEIGDQLLIAISQRLKNSVSNSDFVARLGGDEFTILMESTQETKNLIKAVTRIQKKISVPYTLSQRHISTTCSIGIALSSNSYKEPESMLRDADTAMYRAKNRGKNCYAVFNKHMHSLMLKLLQTEGDLRRAVANEEFEMYYQPLFDLKSGRITSCESLLRWNHPQLGLITPGEFLGVAEETGLMLKLDKFSLSSACQQNYDWQMSGLPKIRVAVNLSLKDVKQKKIKELVSYVLKKTRLEPRYLELELTENILIDLTESSLETLKKLRKMGMSLSIDDFGTGYSSLTYIKRLPSNYLKIDQSFTRDLVVDTATAAIVKSIIDLSHILNIKVVAEGVETQEQLDILKSYGCDKAQGFLLGKPMPASDFTKILETEVKKQQMIE